MFYEVGEKSYGVVMFVDSTHIKIAPVYMIRANTKCYNDVGAVEKYHKDNVRLHGCNLPFSVLLSRCRDGIYAFADVDNLLSFDEKECNAVHMRPLDGGRLISSDMMHELWYHPFPHQLQKQLSYQKDMNVDISVYDDYEP